jgi:hypothetical protein
MGHRTNRPPGTPRPYFRRRFVCPRCERLLGADEVVLDGVRRFKFKQHNADPRKPGNCPGSGRPVDEMKSKALPPDSEGFFRSTETCRPEEWNHRYVAFARSNGRTVEEQASVDDVRGYYSDYILWISDRWAEWARPLGRSRPFSERDHVEFDAWLEERS